MRKVEDLGHAKLLPKVARLLLAVAAALDGMERGDGRGETIARAAKQQLAGLLADPVKQLIQVLAFDGALAAVANTSSVGPIAIQSVAPFAAKPDAATPCSSRDARNSATARTTSAAVAFSRANTTSQPNTKAVRSRQRSPCNASFACHCTE